MEGVVCPTPPAANVEPSGIRTFHFGASTFIGGVVRNVCVCVCVCVSTGTSPFIGVQRKGSMSTHRHDLPHVCAGRHAHSGACNQPGRWLMRTCTLAWRSLVCKNVCSMCVQTWQL